jgi:hypothetical protein
VGPRLKSRIGLLSTVLGAAVLTFVVSLSMALGVRLTPDSATEEPQNVNAAEAAPVTAPPPPHRAAPSPQQAAAAVAKTIVVARPPAPEPAAAPVYEPPAAAPVAPPPVYQPPAPAYVPPPAPLYVPPPPQPRLRDRIIERIPIINRFHEPQYPQ